MTRSQEKLIQGARMAKRILVNQGYPIASVSIIALICAYNRQSDTIEELRDELAEQQAVR